MCVENSAKYIFFPSAVVEESGPNHSTYFTSSLILFSRMHISYTGKFLQW